MKNIKNQIFDSEYNQSYYWDYENYYEYFDLPFKQGMKKKIQRGLHKDSDHIKKDWHRYPGDRGPWYYARILFKNSKGKSVDECMKKFKKRFTDPYAMEAFYSYFHDAERPYYRCNGNYIEDGIIKSFIQERKPTLFDESNYSEKYWDKSNLCYVSKEVFYRYEKLKGEYQIYLNDLRKYNKNVAEGKTHNRWGWLLYEPTFNFYIYNILIAKYPLGFDKIIEGERIPISRKSKIFIENYKEKRNSYLLSKRDFFNYDSFLKVHNKEKKKNKRKSKEEKSYFYSKNHSLHLTMSRLKDMTEEEKEWDYLLRICDEDRS